MFLPRISFFLCCEDDFSIFDQYCGGVVVEAGDAEDKDGFVHIKTDTACRDLREDLPSKLGDSFFQDFLGSRFLGVFHTN